jgi:integrase
MKVEDVAPSGYPLARATVRQRKTGRPVHFELTEQTRQAVDDYLEATGKVPGEFLFTSRRRVGQAMTTRQYARLIAEWITGIGLDPHIFATHSLRRTKATLSGVSQLPIVTCSNAIRMLNSSEMIGCVVCVAHRPLSITASGQ